MRGKVVCFKVGVLVGVILIGVTGGSLSAAQSNVVFEGQVVDVQGFALPGVVVELRTPDRRFVKSTVTNRTGSFVFDDVVSGEYLVVASLLGFQTLERDVTLTGKLGGFAITLEIGTFQQEVTVLAIMPDVATESVLPAREVEKWVAQDLATSLREQPGVAAVRRGPINLDPSIRGLYESQLGMFVDGTRTFAAGPARMDSDISHISPHALRAVRIVRGPYALTWGAGTLSAVQLETFKPEFSGGDAVVGGRAGINYGSNGEAADGFGGVWLSTDRLRFVAQHNTRVGHDYEDGDGNVVPGEYESFDTRWDFGGRPTTDSLVEYSGGYQRQSNIDYPGRILDATFFETQSHAVDVGLTPSGGMVRDVHGQFYVNFKDHLMNNDNKPTALDVPSRVPPFGLRVDLPTSSDTTGGRFHVGFERGQMSYKVGMDVYRLSQSATRTISRRSSGMVLFRDIIWPDATITDVGGYAQAIYDMGGGTVGGTVRIDAERARAGEVSPFFLEHTTGDLDQNNTNISAAATASLRLRDSWLLNVGVGRAVRSPTVLERYSDRFPAVKFQVAAEFMGNPALVPERSLEFNGGTVVRMGQATLEGDVFFRTIGDYITVVPDPSLARRLPLSPPVVYRYIQGDEARFTGYDLRAASPIGSFVDVSGSWSYVWAEDTFFDEPLFGISPFQQQYSVRIHTPDQSRWVEAFVTGTAAQERVATARLEQPTDGWTTLDLRAGFLVMQGLTAKGGVQNLLDELYADHLNSFNPFTSERITEFGRSVYVGLEYDF